MQYLLRARSVLGVMASVLLLGILAGCNYGQSHGGVAVIDLDAVASAIGRDKAISEQVQAFAKQQETKLQALKSELEQQVNNASGQLAEDASAEEKQSLTNKIVEARNQLTQELGQARQSAQQLRQKLVRDFATEVQPIARRVAQKHGLQVVMVKQAWLLVVAPEVDITAEVIADLKQAQRAPITPPLPEQQKPD